MEPHTLRAAVVGAGPAGLAAALRLQSAGASVTLFDAASAPGGRAATDVVGAYRVDPAVQLVSAAYPGFLGLLRDVGAGALLERSPGRDALWRRGKAHEVTYGSPASMLASGALPLALKLRMGAQYLPFLQRHGGDLDLAALERAAAAGLDRESAAAWGGRELGGDFVDLLVSPLLATLYGSAAEEASAGFYHALARQGMNLEVLALRGGIGGFGAACAARVAARGGEVRLGTAVRSVEADGPGARVSGDGWTESFDAALLAVPAPAAVALAPFLTREAAEALSGVRTRPALTLALLLDRPVGVRWFGLSFARGEAGAVAALCVEENKVGGLVPPGKGLLLAFAATNAADRLAGTDANGVARALLPEIARVLPRVESAIVEARVYRWRDGWTLFPPGSLGRLPTLRSIAYDAAPRVAFAGDWLVAPTVEGAVASGRAAAERLLSRL